MVYSEFHLYRRPTTLGVTFLVAHVLKTDLLLKVQNHVHQLSRNAALLISEERVDFDSSSIFIMIHWRCLFLGERLFLCFFSPVGRLTLGLIVPFKDFIVLLVGFLISMFRLRWWTNLSTRSPPPTVLPGGVIF